MGGYFYLNDTIWRKFRLDDKTNHGEYTTNPITGLKYPTEDIFRFDRGGLSAYSFRLLFGSDLSDEIDTSEVEDDIVDNSKSEKIHERDNIYGIFEFAANDAHELEPLLTFEHSINHRDWIPYRGNAHLNMWIGQETLKDFEIKARWKLLRGSLISKCKVLPANQNTHVGIREYLSVIKK